MPTSGLGVGWIEGWDVVEHRVTVAANLLSAAGRFHFF
jgi:hypothetical protein